MVVLVGMVGVHVGGHVNTLAALDHEEDQEDHWKMRPCGAAGASVTEGEDLAEACIAHLAHLV